MISGGKGNKIKQINKFTKNMRAIKIIPNIGFKIVINNQQQKYQN